MKTVIKILLVSVVVFSGTSCQKEPSDYSLIGCVINNEVFISEGKDACKIGMLLKPNDNYRSGSVYFEERWIPRSLFSDGYMLRIFMAKNNQPNQGGYSISLRINWTDYNNMGSKEIPLSSPALLDLGYDLPESAFIQIGSFQFVSGRVIIDSIGKQSESSRTYFRARFEMDVTDKEGTLVKIRNGRIIAHN